MAQHDYVIDNQSAPLARADINSALQAIVSQNSGATAPATTYANMFWYDTATNQVKKRNEANSAWIVLGTIDETTGKFDPNASFTAVQQGGGPSQSTNKVNIGWNAIGMFMSVDGTSLGRIVTNADATGASGTQLSTQMFSPGNAPLYANRAWVVFGGNGTVFGSANVSSVSRPGTGTYTVNFATAMQDGQFAPNITITSPNTSTYPYVPVWNSASASQVSFQTITATVGLFDPPVLAVSIVR